MIPPFIRNGALLLALLLLSACAEDVKSSKTKDGGSSSSNKVYTLSWAAPTTFESGDLLTPETDVLEYRVYYGDSSTSLTNNFITVAPTEKSVSTSGLDQSIISSISTVYVAMTTVSSEGVESALSTVISFNPK